MDHDKALDAALEAAITAAREAEAIEAQTRAEDELCPLLHGPEDMRRALMPRGFMSPQRAFGDDAP